MILFRSFDPRTSSIDLGGLMFYVLVAVVSYLVLNISIWLACGQGGLMVLVGANALGALITFAVYYKSEVKDKGPPRAAALVGGVGILLMLGVRQAHGLLPVSISMESIYNGFAITSWPLFLLLHIFSPKNFSEKPIGST